MGTAGNAIAKFFQTVWQAWEYLFNYIYSKTISPLLHQAVKDVDHDIHEMKKAAHKVAGDLNYHLPGVGWLTGVNESLSFIDAELDILKDKTVPYMLQQATKFSRIVLAGALGGLALIVTTFLLVE